MTGSITHTSAGGASLDDDLGIDVERLSAPAGLELKEHEVYLDLANPGHGPFRALPGQTAGSGNRYVAEADVTPETWHQLIKRDAEASAEHIATADPTITAA
jgi:hypothetical protein